MIAQDTPRRSLSCESVAAPPRRMRMTILRPRETCRAGKRACQVPSVNQTRNVRESNQRAPGRTLGANTNFCLWLTPTALTESANTHRSRHYLPALPQLTRLARLPYYHAIRNHSPDPAHTRNKKWLPGRTVKANTRSEWRERTIERRKGLCFSLLREHAGNYSTFALGVRPGSDRDSNRGRG